MSRPDPLPELLAPAGSLETFFAALDKGADAVYCGLKEFSARARAKNFTLDEMGRMTAHAHSLGKRVYVTLNTIVKERELTPLVETLSALESFGVDGVILQDMAVARIVRRHFPSIPLHASTQMTIHNSAGVTLLARLGFSRVVLARELTMEELANVIAKSPIEVECFVHGALCFSWSGQCYFSSFLGGQSGNRGRCTQPCRRLYRHQGKAGYYFSTTDFSAIDHLHDLRRLGVASFKIEGRMKSAEYVATVVEAYRTVLDAPPDQLPDALARGKELLKRSYGRPPTKGFLLTRNPTDIAIPTLRGATGRFLGTIATVGEGNITFTTREKLHVGDRIRIQPRSDLPGTGVTVRELTVRNRPVTSAEAGSTVTIPVPVRPSRGDAIFKVSSETAYTLSEAACRRRLADARPLLPVDLRITICPDHLTIMADVQGERWETTLPLPTEESRGESDLTEVFWNHFSRTGGTPFTLRSLELADPLPLFVPPSYLKELRRSFYQELERIVLPRIADSRRRRLAAALAEIRTPPAPRRKERPRLLLRVSSPRDLALLNHEGVGALSLPLSPATLKVLDQIAARVSGREERLYWQLPMIVMEEELSWHADAIDTVIARGLKRFVVSNPAHFWLLDGRPVTVITDHTLFSLNSQAILLWHELGAGEVTLSMEDDRENVALLLRADLPVRRSMILHSPLRLLTSRIAVRGVRPDAPFTTDRGDRFTVRRVGENTTISHERDFSLIHHRTELQELGCTSFQIDLRGSRVERVRELLDAFRTATPLPRTTEGNFLLGLA